MKSWNSPLKSLILVSVRSTCASPSTARRTFIPSSRRCVSSIGISPRFRSGGQKVEKRGGELRRALDIGDVRRRQFDIASVVDLPGQPASVGRRRGNVVRAGDDQGTRRDGMYRVAMVHVANGSAARD